MGVYVYCLNSVGYFLLTLKGRPYMSMFTQAIRRDYCCQILGLYH